MTQIGPPKHLTPHDRSARLCVRQDWSFEGGALCGGASSSHLRARVSHGRSLRWRRSRRTHRLGDLPPFPRDTPIYLRFYDEMRRSGFVEGQNLAVEYRDYGLHPELISEYAAELI
jgi:hypothetical protein